MTLLTNERIGEMIRALPDEEKRQIIKSWEQYIKDKPAAKRIFKMQIIKLRRTMNGDS